MTIVLKASTLQRFKALGPEIVQAVELRLQSGNYREVAEWMHKELKVLTDIKPETLRKSLERYALGTLRPKLLKNIEDAARGKATTTIAKRLSVHDELERLALDQRARVDRLLIKEQSLPAGLTLKDLSNEMRLLKDILMDTGKLQLEIGILARAPRRVTGEMREADGTVREFSWSEEQEQLFKTIDGELTKREEVEDA